MLLGDGDYSVQITSAERLAVGRTVIVLCMALRLGKMDGSLAWVISSKGTQSGENDENNRRLLKDYARRQEGE